MRSCGLMPRELERTRHHSEHVHHNPHWADGRHVTWRIGKLSRIRSSHYHTEHIVFGVGATCKHPMIVHRSRTFQLSCHRARLRPQWTPLAICRNVLFLCSSQNTCNCYHLRAGIRGQRGQDRETGPRRRRRLDDGVPCCSVQAPPLPVVLMMKTWTCTVVEELGAEHGPTAYNS
jgi:hypothetical protein